MAEEQRVCGLGIHKLKTPYRFLENSQWIKFGQRINPQLRSQPLCLSCYKSLIRLFNIHKDHAKSHAERIRTVSVIPISDTSEGTRILEPGSPSSFEDEGPTTSDDPAAKRARKQEADKTSYVDRNKEE